jgi:NAD(P)-dependent dehydrogenase (short-subunit alcohol dehydrogenase family)
MKTSFTLGMPLNKSLLFGPPADALLPATPAPNPGSYGIGFGITKQFVQECATVFFCARNKERGLQAQAYLRTIDTSSCKTKPGPATFFQADVRNITALRAFIKKAGDFDIAVNNAAVGGYGIRRLVDIEDKYLQPDFAFDAIAINVYGMLYSMKVELEHWEKQCKADANKCSRVMVVIGSIAGITSSPNNAVYAASKAAVNSLCKSVAMEYKPPVQGVFRGDGPLNVRINCIAPGPVNTPLMRNFGKSFSQYGSLYPWQCWKEGKNGTLVKSDGATTGPNACPDIKLGEPINVQAFKGGQGLTNTRMGEAEEEAAMVLNMASDDASFVRGAVLTVDGGFTAY